MALAPVLAPEDEITGPGHVRRGHEGADHPDPEEEGVAAPAGAEEDLVLRPEAGQGEDAGEGEGAHDERPERGGHVLPEAAHVTHVVRVHGVDQRAGAEEEEGFEEGVGEEMEDARRPRPDTEGHHHVAQLADRRVGEDALDVVLHEGKKRPDDHGDAADQSEGVDAVAQRADRETSEEHAVDAGHQVDAGHDHGGGVDQR